MGITFNQLKKLITKKEIDTVLVCVSDMQGRLNGKRVTGKAFIEYVYKETHMCDYCLLYTSPSPRDVEESRMPSSA